MNSIPRFNGMQWRPSISSNLVPALNRVGAIESAQAEADLAKARADQAAQAESNAAVKYMLAGGVVGLALGWGLAKALK